MHFFDPFSRQKFSLSAEHRLAFQKGADKGGEVPPAEKAKGEQELVDHLKELQANGTTSHEAIAKEVRTFLEKKGEIDASAIAKLREQAQSALTALSGMEKIPETKIGELMALFPKDQKEMLMFAKKHGWLNENITPEQAKQPGPAIEGAKGPHFYYRGLQGKEQVAGAPEGEPNPKQMYDTLKRLSAEITRGQGRINKLSGPNVYSKQRVTNASEINQAKSLQAKLVGQYTQLCADFEAATGTTFSMASRQEMEAKKATIVREYDEDGELVRLYDTRTGSSVSKGATTEDVSNSPMTPRQRDLLLNRTNSVFNYQLRNRANVAKIMQKPNNAPLTASDAPQQAHLRRIEGAGDTIRRSGSGNYVAADGRNLPRTRAEYDLDRNLVNTDYSEQYNDMLNSQTHGDVLPSVSGRRGSRKKSDKVSDELKAEYIPELESFVEENLDKYKNDPAYATLKRAYERKKARWDRSPQEKFHDLADMRAQIEAFEERAKRSATDNAVLQSIKENKTKVLGAPFEVPAPNGRFFNPNEKISIRIPAKQFGGKREALIFYNPFTELGVLKSEDYSILQRMGIVIDREYSETNVYKTGLSRNRPRVTNVTFYFTKPIELAINGSSIRVSTDEVAGATPAADDPSQVPEVQPEASVDNDELKNILDSLSTPDVVPSTPAPAPAPTPATTPKPVPPAAPSVPDAPREEVDDIIETLSKSGPLPLDAPAVPDVGGRVNDLNALPKDNAGIVRFLELNLEGRASEQEMNDIDGGYKSLKISLANGEKITFMLTPKEEKFTLGSVILNRDDDAMNVFDNMREDALSIRDIAKILNNYYDASHNALAKVGTPRPDLGEVIKAYRK